MERDGIVEKMEKLDNGEIQPPKKKLPNPKPCNPRTLPMPTNITEWRKMGTFWVAATLPQFHLPYNPTIHLDKCSDCGMGIRLDNFPHQYERIPPRCRYVCRKCNKQMIIVDVEAHLVDIHPSIEEYEEEGYDGI
jgi:hypothetical protein